MGSSHEEIHTNTNTNLSKNGCGGKQKVLLDEQTPWLTAACYEKDVATQE